MYDLTLLRALGWADAQEKEFDNIKEEGLEPARVIALHRGSYALATPRGECTARPSGRFVHLARAADMPAVGTGSWFAASGKTAG